MASPEYALPIKRTFAEASGYTKAVLIEGGCSTVEGLINPDDDLDGRFTCFDLDGGRFIRVNGWCCDIHFDGDD